MKALTCDMCGSNDITMDPSGEFGRCDFCGTKYTKETLRIKIENFRGIVNVQGAVETIVGNSELERKYSNLLRFIEFKDSEHAYATLNTLRLEFPDDARVWLASLKMAVAFDYGLNLEDIKHANTCAGGQELIYQELDSLIKSHGSELRLSSPQSCAYSFSTGKKINDYYKLSGLDQYLIFNSKPLLDYMGYQPIHSFITDLTKKYVDGIKSGKICPNPPRFIGDKISIPHMVDPFDWMTQDEHLEGYICASHNVPLKKPEYNGGPMHMGEHLVWGIITVIGPWLITSGYDDIVIYRMNHSISRDKIIEYRRKKRICIHCETPMKFGGLFKYAPCHVCGLDSY